MSELYALLETALNNRAPLLKKLHSEKTDTYRLFHGVNEGKPGLSIDRFGLMVLIRTVKDPLTEPEIQEIKTTLRDKLDFLPYLVYNHGTAQKAYNVPIEGEPEPDMPHVCRELGVRYRVKGVHRGNDSLIFPDFRAGRRYVIENSNGKSFLNLFAYTCTAGIAALKNGATEVWNVDFAASAFKIGKENIGLNDLSPKSICFVKQDVQAVTRQLAGLGIKGKARNRDFLRFKPRQFDMTLLDPPTYAKSPFGTVDIIRDYQGLFKPALLSTAEGGTLICTNHSAKVELNEWLGIMERCAAKAGRNIQNIETITPESDFPSRDQHPPLKIAVLKL